MEKKTTISKGNTQHQATNQTSNLEVIKTDAEHFNNIVFGLLEKNYRLAHMFATDDTATNKTFGVHVLLAPEAKNEWIQVSIALPEKNPKYESLTKNLPSTNWYERYIMDMFGIVAEGHPDHRRLVHHENMPLNTHPLRKDFAWNTILKKENHPHPMHHVEGNGIYEISVGPIHAGIIEPGHFRFNVAGERIITLEGKLFFTHKGAEKIMEGKKLEEALPFVERISMDSAAGHALAYCQAVEKITNTQISEKTTLLRTLIAELERITMHIHDLANIAGMGTGYSVMAAHGFRIKEKLVRLSEEIFGNRFWRGFIVPGGVDKDLEKSELKLISETTKEVVEEMQDLLKMGLNSDGLCERLVSSGVLKPEAAKAYGAVGIAARASGINMDTRVDHPYAAYPRLNFTVAVKQGNGVFARYMVRVEELEASYLMVQELLKLLGQQKEVKGHVKTAINFTAAQSANKANHKNEAAPTEAISAVEGWRGEIIYFVRLNEKGLIDRISVRDASFCNWPLFGEIGPGNIIPDFPLCNKSLDLSYSGTDL